ncbi:OLC1v1030001C1 [Oldenlandia corymbosa var. corymbosa]|uniref:OLC1v1030001C1 n=1 Tax=Oldenlandia corymbosa var. corymbosa TaxID=529605 RepID=A0AAV1CF79_OLDCO|nr:OLC1v1030001C1 [Oldenlandia corymbosa var. corymbosa]
MAVRPPPPSGTIAIAVLFFFLGVAAARTPSILQVNELPAADADVSHSLTLPISQINQILRLPSDDVNVNPDPESAQPITVRSVPLTRVTIHDFRPIDRRHVSVSSTLPNRICIHRHRLNIQPLLKPVDETMLPLTSDGGAEEEEKKEIDPATVNWVKLPHHHHHHHHHHRRHHHIHRHHDDEDDDGLDGFSKYLMKHRYDKFGREKGWKHLNHNKRRDHDDEEVEEMKKPEIVKREEAQGGIVQRIRKFLAHI